MLPISINEEIFLSTPQFKCGFIYYHDIVVDESPNMLKGRLDFFQEKIRADLLEKSYSEFEGLNEWRKIFKQLGIDPQRYRPSHESLFRRIGKGTDLPFVHSAVDLNNFFSLQYEIPIGIYDISALRDYIKISIGTETDEYEGLNGRKNRMRGKLLAADGNGAFGSPIVDSIRTKTDKSTTEAVQIFFLRPSMSVGEAEELLQAAAKMFFQLHSGNSEIKLLHRQKPEAELSLNR
ncbi:B3/4 domain-containing protein [Alteribacillus sp. HJP-4]|uniref:B3/B4 domain-containing protein n=1 Tax=Alteribacillus sp. HJP-4 TaxID=2775394 RepID=UPI0035CD0F93